MSSTLHTSPEEEEGQRMVRRRESLRIIGRDWIQGLGDQYTEQEEEGQGYSGATWRTYYL